MSKFETGKPVVDILLATYNGEAFLEHQLQTICEQDYPAWRLLVHDDGSTDQTLRIIRSFQERDQRVQLLDDGVIGLGAAYNFLHLLAYSTADYIAFADQDDHWLPNKISEQLAFIRNKDEQCTKATAVYCNAQFWIKGKPLPQHVNIFYPTCLAQYLFLNGGIIGCSILFNKPLRDRLFPLPIRVAMHDHFVITAALCWGALYYQDRSLLHYRQHERNVTGIQDRGVWGKLKGKFLAGRTLVDQQHFEAHQVFYQHYEQQLTGISRELFQAYFNIIGESSRWKRLLAIKEHHFRLGHKKYILYLKTILRN